MDQDDARLFSRLLWEARERLDMHIDMVESMTNKVDAHGRRLLAEIDDFRAKKGWNPNGFGGE